MLCFLPELVRGRFYCCLSKEWSRIHRLHGWGWHDFFEVVHLGPDLIQIGSITGEALSIFLGCQPDMDSPTAAICPRSKLSLAKNQGESIQIASIQEGWNFSPLPRYLHLKNKTKLRSQSHIYVSSNLGLKAYELLILWLEEHTHTHHVSACGRVSSLERGKPRAVTHVGIRKPASSIGENHSIVFLHC